MFSLVALPFFSLVSIVFRGPPRFQRISIRPRPAFLMVIPLLTIGPVCLELVFPLEPHCFSVEWRSLVPVVFLDSVVYSSCFPFDSHGLFVEWLVLVPLFFFSKFPFVVLFSVRPPLYFYYPPAFFYCDSLWFLLGSPSFSIGLVPRSPLQK